MRVVLVVQAFPKLSESFIVNKFLGLLERGWDVHVVCAQTPAEDRRHFPALAAPQVRRRVHRRWPVQPLWLGFALLPLAVARGLILNPGTTLRFLWRGWRQWEWEVWRQYYASAAIIWLRPALVHFEFGALAVGRMHLGELLGCAVVTSFRGYDINFVGLEEPGYYEEVWRGSDALHFLGEDLWRRALRRGCPSQIPHVFIPPAVDPSFWDPGERVHREITGTSARPLRVLSVGRLEWKKGYEYGLQAIALLVRQGICCEYRIVGDGAFLEAIAFARHQLELEGAVHWFGAQPREEVRRQMLWADVFLHAAVSEGFCNAVLEAQAMALPVVCSDADGLAENVEDGETGYVVERRNPENLAERLRQLANDPRLRQRMGEAGRMRVLRRFRLGDQISAFEQLYRGVLGGRFGRRGQSRGSAKRKVPVGSAEVSPTAAAAGGDR